MQENYLLLAISISRKQKNEVSVVSYGPHNPICRKKEIPSIFICSSTGLAIKIKDGQLIRTSNKQDGSISYRDIDDSILQVLNELRAHIMNRKYKLLYVPIIITNTDLFKIKYSRQDIDSEGNLNKIEPPEKIPFLAYNFSMDLTEKGFYIEGPTPIWDNTITVFIVNIENVKPFCEFLNTHLLDLCPV